MQIRYGNLLIYRRPVNEQLTNGWRTVNEHMVRMCARLKPLLTVRYVKHQIQISKVFVTRSLTGRTFDQVSVDGQIAIRYCQNNWRATVKSFKYLTKIIVYFELHIS